MQDTRKGGDTKERLLEAAEAAVLEKGFAGTSIEELIAAVGITKNGFFYHFKDKNELARRSCFATCGGKTLCSTNCSPASTS